MMSATKIYHKATLLTAENQSLRREIEALSRRRRAKRTQSQKAGVLTVGEGQELIDQIDVNTQVVAESSRRGGQGSSARPRERRCGRCGKTGHNSRTC
jgi:hypothetical protein